MPRTAPLPFPLLLLGAALVAAPTSAAGAGNGDPWEPVRQALAEAEASLQAGESQIAESRYRTVLLESWLLAGHLELERGRLTAARSAFERAGESAVETRRPWFALAFVDLLLGDEEAAVQRLVQVLAQDRGDLATRRLLASALMRAGQVDESVQVFEEMRALAPNDLENLFLLARAYLSRSDLARADELFSELAQGAPIPQTHVLIGRVYRDHGDYARARSALTRALEMDPRVRRAHYYLGTIDVFDQGLGLLDSAIGHFEAELALAPDDTLTNLYLGMALVEQRRYAEAVSCLEIAAGARQPKPYVFQFLGRAYLAVGRPDDAVVALRRGLQLSAEAPALDAASSAVDFRERQLASLHYQLALALRRTGDEAAAAEHFEAAKRASARSTEGSREILSRYFAEDGGEDLSILSPPPEMARLTGLSPDERDALDRASRAARVQAYFNLGVLQTRSENFERAAGLFAEAAAIDPEFPRLQFSLGTAWFNAGRFELAAEPLERARQAEPGDLNLRRMLALAWLNSRRYEKAVELLADDPGRGGDRSLQYAYAVALVRSGRARQAEPIFGELLARHGDWPELNVVLGQAHAQLDDYQAAVEALERALELDPEVAEARSTLGDIYLRQGRLAEAEEAFRAELRLHPDDRRTRHKLAVALDLNRQPEEAIDILRRLLDAEPQFTDARYLLGKILLARGELDEAREHLEAAVGLAPGDANIRYQLGQAYQQLGRVDEARREFDAHRRLKKGSDG